MLRGLFSAASGMIGQQTLIDNIANNLANVNTTGYKKGRLEFHDLIYETVRAPGATLSTGAQLPTGIQFGHGSRVVASTK